MANHIKESYPVVVVMVPLPAQGHLNQLLHLSRLISAHDIPVYYVGATTHIRQAKLRIHGWDLNSTTNIHFHEFAPPPFDNPPPNPNTSTKFPLQMMPSVIASTHLREPVFAFVNKISSKFRKVVVIYDSLMAYVVQDIGSVLNAEAYCFRAISAISVVGMHESPTGEETVSEVPSIEGIFPPEFAEFRAMQGEARKIFSQVIFNSSREIEGFYLDLLVKKKITGADKIWALGPFNPISVQSKTEYSNTRHRCLEWLDKQGKDSVIFVSFGTTSSVSNEQIKEIAFGLERSEQKFIWVLRDADKGDIFTGEFRKVELPKGVEESVKERGMIVRDWAPQLEILGHFATGGFMSHCGWNSCMESISMGVPIASWPMHSDQPANAVLVTKVLKIGVQVKKWSVEDELVSSRNVEMAVRKLMASGEGDEMRKRAVELGENVRNAAVEGGATYNEIKSFIAQITK